MEGYADHAMDPTHAFLLAAAERLRSGAWSRSTGVAPEHTASDAATGTCPSTSGPACSPWSAPARPNGPVSAPPSPNGRPRPRPARGVQRLRGCTFFRGTERHPPRRAPHNFSHNRIPSPGNSSRDLRPAWAVRVTPRNAKRPASSGHRAPRLGGSGGGIPPRRVIPRGAHGAATVGGVSSSARSRRGIPLAPSG